MRSDAATRTRAAVIPSPRRREARESAAVSSPRVVNVSSDEPPRPERDMRGTAFALAGVGMTNAVSALLGAGIGWFVDERANTLPTFMLLGLVAGIALGVLATYKEVRKYLQS